MNGLFDFFSKLFDTAGFPARWFCGSGWSDAHGWTHVTADLVIFTAYFCIPISLYLFVSKTKRKNFSKLFYLFAAFIFSCGTIHLIEAGIFWVPLYRLSAVVKVFTAIISVWTAIELVSALLGFFRQRSSEELEALVDKKTKEIEELNKKLSDALEAAEVGTFKWNLKNGTASVDPNWRKIFKQKKGYKLSSYEDFKKLIREEDITSLESHVAEIIEKDLPYETTFRLSSKISETPIYVAGKGHVIKDDNGEAEYITGVNYDVTELVKAQKDLEEANELLNLASEMSGLGHWYIDLEANTIFWSDVIYDIHGVSPESYSPELESAINFYHPDDVEMVKEAVRKAVEEKEAFSFEARLVQPDGNIRHVRSASRLKTNSNGEVIQIFGTFLDLTKEKQIQNELQRSNRELEQFAYITSHDLQEPLRTVNTYVDLLLEYMNRSGIELGEKEKRFTNYIDKSCKHMRNMIKDVLNYSRVGRDGEIQNLKLKDIVAAAIKNNEQSIGESAALIHVHGDDTSINARPTELLQLFQNLISNAIKYKDPKRKPEINIHIKELSPQELQIQIQDNGLGIKPEYHEKIFEVFQRLDKSDDYQGTGIGLALCKKIVENYQGKISLDSKEGVGTSFYFRLQSLTQKSEVLQ